MLDWNILRDSSFPPSLIFLPNKLNAIVSKDKRRGKHENEPYVWVTFLVVLIWSYGTGLLFCLEWTARTKVNTKKEINNLFSVYLVIDLRWDSSSSFVESTERKVSFEKFEQKNVFLLDPSLRDYFRIRFRTTVSFSNNLNNYCVDSHRLFRTLEFLLWDDSTYIIYCIRKRKSDRCIQEKHIIRAPFGARTRLLYYLYIVWDPPTTRLNSFLWDFRGRFLLDNEVRNLNKWVTKEKKALGRKYLLHVLLALASFWSISFLDETHPF